MRVELSQVLPSAAYDLRVVDVSDEPDLIHRYGLRVPVLTKSDGEEICEHRLDHDAVLRLAAGTGH